MSSEEKHSASTPSQHDPSAVSPSSTMDANKEISNDDDGNRKNQRKLMEACQKGDAEAVSHLLRTGRGCSASQQDPHYRNGSSPLIEAARTGSLETCRILLEHGAPWNAIDKDGKCAGNYASDLGHQSLVNYLVDVAVTAELLLGASIRTEMSTTYTSKEATKPIVDIGTGSRCGGPVEHEPCTKSDFLSRDVCYVDGDKLLDGDGDAVMMEWERPLMRAHASVIMGGSGTSATGKVSVMNVGFGMGIIDSILQEEQFSPALHVIVEAHPGVYAQMIKDGWDKKPNVRIVYGKWQDEVPKLIEEGIKFDGVFFDTYGEHFTDLEDFQNLLVDLLKKPAGVYSFFNGLAPDNIFFHGVACQCVKLQLSGIGFNVEFATCDIDVSDEAWKGVRRKYWHNCTYYLPIITWANENS